MSSVVIPKESLSAYQRWELESFDESESSAAPGKTRPVTLPTVEQTRKIREDARLEGFAAGLEEGRIAGQAEGRHRVDAQVERLETIARQFRAELARADEAIACELLDLALDLAKAMLSVGLTIRPQLVIPVVCEAIRYLPALHQPAMLFLHPEDASLIKNCLGDELAKGGWLVTEDALIERGGCRIETASNQIDATVGTRWRRIAASLGRESAWLP
jgi:flagellar assembly protein FliH